MSLLAKLTMDGRDCHPFRALLMILTLCRSNRFVQPKIAIGIRAPLEIAVLAACFRMSLELS
jgi:hypothetical protein